MLRNSLGKHIIAEFYQCNRLTINDQQAVEKIMTDAVLISGAKIIQPFFHKFSPHGVSGIIVISESHFAVHTWPEYSYAAVDLFSCSEFMYEDALRHIRDKIGSQKYSIALINRGFPSLTGSSECDISTEQILI